MIWQRMTWTFFVAAVAAGGLLSMDQSERAVASSATASRYANRPIFEFIMPRRVDVLADGIEANRLYSKMLDTSEGSAYYQELARRLKQQRPRRLILLEEEVGYDFLFLADYGENGLIRSTRSNRPERGLIDSSGRSESFERALLTLKSLPPRIDISISDAAVVAISHPYPIFLTWDDGTGVRSLRMTDMVMRNRGERAEEKIDLRVLDSLRKAIGAIHTCANASESP